MAKDKDKVGLRGHDLITDTELKHVRKALIGSHANLVVQGMLDKDVRSKLKKIIEEDYDHVTKGNEVVVDYIISETIGTGVIEDILNNPDITDIGYNGSQLIVETNDEKFEYDTNFDVTEDYIIRLINKFANTNNKEFTPKNPIFDGRFENVRINAVHSQNTAPESGTTMSLRVVRPKLVLGEHNFKGLAPMFMLDFFEAGARAQSNMVISGTTGTGKTELHKLISSYISFKDRILLIEDTPETFMKEMFYDKDVYSWLTTEELSVTDLIKAGLRNQPVWIMVTETRGQEAYEMIQAVLSGHSIITSLHAVDARAIPSRFVNMAKMGYEFSEESLTEDILRYFNFGIHLERTEYKGHVVRYLQEVVEFTPDGINTIFKQRFLDGKYMFETFELSDDFKEDLENVGHELNFPENFRSERPFNYDQPAPFEVTVPLDDTDRPDYDRINLMGTTIEELMKEGDKKKEEESRIKEEARTEPVVRPASKKEKPAGDKLESAIKTKPKQETEEDIPANARIEDLEGIVPNPSLSNSKISKSKSSNRRKFPVGRLSEEEQNEDSKRKKLKLKIKGAEDDG